MSNLINSGEQAFKDFDAFFKLLTAEDQINIDLEVTSSELNGEPSISIQINGDELLLQSLPEGTHTLHVDYPTTTVDSLHIRISMLGKGINDTKLVNGAIVKDKFVRIDRLLINNYDLTADPDLFYNHLRYTNNEINEPVKNGFWQNSTLHIECTTPFSEWYQQHTSRNTGLSSSLIYQDNKELAEQQYNKLISKLPLLK